MLLFIYTINDLRECLRQIKSPLIARTFTDESRLKTLFSIVTDYGNSINVDHNKLEDAAEKVATLYEDLHYEKRT